VALRTELLDRDRAWHAEAELLYMVTARADLVAKVILPALRDGRVVLSDRFDLSTLVYQGAGRGLPLEMVRWVNQGATQGLVPDVTLVLDVEPVEGRRRREAAGKGDRLDAESEEFHRRVHAAYLAAAGPGVHHLQGDASPERVLDAAWRVLVAVRPDRFRPWPAEGVA
jgi:dTMP kinase